MNRIPRPGDLCLVIDPAFDAGKAVTAIRQLPSHLLARWEVSPPVRCWCEPVDGSPGYFEMVPHIEERLLLPIPPDPCGQSVELEDAFAA
jgi:hypothetical protein